MYCYYFHVSTVAICTCLTLTTHIKKKKITKKENCLNSNQFSYISNDFKLTKLYIYIKNISNIKIYIYNQFTCTLIFMYTQLQNKF